MKLNTLVKQFDLSQSLLVDCKKERPFTACIHLGAAVYLYYYNRECILTSQISPPYWR
jgi:hypothetical protein